MRNDILSPDDLEKIRRALKREGAVLEDVDFIPEEELISAIAPCCGAITKHVPSMLVEGATTHCTCGSKYPTLQSIVKH